MEFRILGPLEVVRDGTPLVIGAAKPRALLALLLIHADEVVSSDRLIDGLWGEEAPATAQKALQVYISQLRKTLDPGILLTQPPGYVLRPARLDLREFHEMLTRGQAARSEGDPEAASRELGAALALWRGPPLSGLEFEPFAAAEIARLDELRLTALEERMEADLELGRHSELVAGLERLVTDNPVRERLARQLMLALYRSGRQTESLEVFRRTREGLLELGLEPSRALRDLERAILNQDPALEASDRAETEPAGGAEAFVGRREELRDLHAALERGLAGRGGVFLLAGEPGIGKSRLAEEAARRAEDRGATVLWGRGWEAGGAPAYWVWVQALRSYVQGVDPGTLRRQLGRGAPEIAQILPALRDVLPDLGEPTAPESEGARFRLFDAVTSFLRAAAGTRPLALIFDDLHAADTPSLLLLQFVARELSRERIVVIATFRDVAPVPGDVLTATLAELARERGTRRIALQGLPLADVARIIHSTTGLDPPEALTEAIHAETEGNPLFVTEVARLLASEDRLEAEAWRPAIPPGVREVIGQRLRLVSEGCRSTLGFASVIGREFDVTSLERLADEPQAELLAALDEATEARLVGDSPGTPGRLRFSHALIRDTLYDELPSARRALMHRRLGETLEELHAHDLDPHLAELAHHFWQASETGKAVDYAWAAGDRAVRLLAFEEAARLYERSLEALERDRPDDVSRRCELLLTLGEARMRAGDSVRAREALRDAAAAARQAGTPEQLARAAELYGGRFVWPRAISDDAMLPLLEEALAALGEGDSTLKVRILARLTTARRSDPSRARMDALGRQAVEMARRIGDDLTLAYVLDAHVSAMGGPPNVADHEAAARELIAVARSAGDREREFSGHENLLNIANERGDPETVEAELAAMVELADELRQPAQRWLVAVVRATRALNVGDFDRAEEMIEEAYSVGQNVESWSAGVCRGTELLVLRRARGRLSELEETHPLEQFASPLVVRCVRIRLDAETRRSAEAAGALVDLAGEDLATLHLDEEWTFCMSLLAEACALLGEARPAAKLYDVLSPYSGLNVIAVPEVLFGSVDRVLGVLAGMRGRWEEAEGHFTAALEMDRRMGARPWAAHTRHDHAAMLLARDGPGDRERAAGLLAEATSAYEELGMESWAKRALAQADGQSESSTRSMR
jgi:DNA-binding SARP family transcriptional activator